MVRVMREGRIDEPEWSLVAFVCNNCHRVLRAEGKDEVSYYADMGGDYLMIDCVCGVTCFKAVPLTKQERVLYTYVIGLEEEIEVPLGLLSRELDES